MKEVGRHKHKVLECSPLKQVMPVMIQMKKKTMHIRCLWMIFSKWESTLRVHLKSKSVFKKLNKLGIIKKESSS